MKKILVSAGHTNVKGQDRGAEGNGFIEGVEAVKIRDAVAVRLRQKGFTVTEDGADGESEPLKKAIALMRQADEGIEIHFNAGPPKATGVEIYSMLSDKVMYQRVATKVSECLKIPLRGDKGWKSEKQSQHNRLGFVQAGGAILEVCFISNPKDMAAYQLYFDLMCIGITNAIAGDDAVKTDPLTVPKPQLGETHTVVSGENLSSIAKKHGTTVTALQNLNKLTTDRILPGQILRLK